VWSGYKVTGLIFLPTPCGLGNSERGGILACHTKYGSKSAKVGVGRELHNPTLRTVRVEEINDGCRIKEEEAFVVREVLRGSQRQVSICL
jgi:hypothetical protein